MPFQVPAVIPVMLFPCAECNRKFNDNAKLQKHLQDEHGIVRWFPCHLCAKTFSDAVQAELHVKNVHSGKMKQHTYVCWLCADQGIIKSYTQPGMLTKHFHIIHKMARQLIDRARILAMGASNAVSLVKAEAGSEESAVLGQPLSVRNLRTAGGGDVIYCCAGCDFSSEERKTFQVHILKHREDSSFAQCLECGSCFTSKPTLKRHLIAVHRIRDLDKYAADSGAKLELIESHLEMDLEMEVDVEGKSPQLRAKISSVTNLTPKSKSGDESETASSDQKKKVMECNVCYRKFEGLSALRLHMRIHGMAFIQGTRRKSTMQTSNNATGVSD